MIECFMQDNILTISDLYKENMSKLAEIEQRSKLNLKTIIEKYDRELWDMESYLDFFI